MSLRFLPQAATAMREAVRDAGGMEVFAIGDVDRGAVTEVVIAARGQADRVLAVLGRPRSGQVVIHNHPSNDLRPSDADMRLAALYSEEGVGFVIVDSGVTRSHWVMEPWDAAPKPIDPEVVDRFFTEAIPRVMQGAEVRQAQRDMARAVTDTLNQGRPLVIEAGTGTGKSLAYLVPAALWALANDKKVVIATHTRALQAQLLQSDLPLLSRAGVEVRAAVLEGRGNYLCKRRLALAREESEDLDPDALDALDAIEHWSQVTAHGSRTDLATAVPSSVWDKVQSDTDLTLRMRCEHYESCHFYEARRRAAGAHLVVINHALLMADLAIRDETGHGVLPSYGRVILDEAHHLEDVATGLTSMSVSALAIRRAVAPLLSRRKRRGALARLVKVLEGDPRLPRDIAETAGKAARMAGEHMLTLPRLADLTLSEVAGVLDPADPTRRVDDAYEQHAEWIDIVEPQLRHLYGGLERGTGLLLRLMESMGDHRLPEAQAQPLLDVARAHRRLVRHTEQLAGFLKPVRPEGGEAHVRWLELAHRRGSSPSAQVRAAPIDVAATLRRMLWEPLPGIACTSATLSVGGSFQFFKDRHGLDSPTEAVLPSPFNHFEQAILGMPTDLPSPEHPDYLARTARVIVEAVEISGGGAFVLCTSYRAVDTYAAALRSLLPDHVPVLAQGTVGRSVLLERFRQHPSAVLVGTDSFWEGVSVKGHQLRLVILPRLPFRVPTDPLSQARQERMEAQGIDPFGAYTLPAAILKLRQGYGRLLRSRKDRGVVLLLDVRVHSRGYGRKILAALPPARRIKADWSRIAAAMRQFYADGQGPIPDLRQRPTR